jgi:hypothetical protein
LNKAQSAEGGRAMTNELRHLIKVHSGHEACSDQKSLGDLLADLREAADDLDLDFDQAFFQSRTRFESLDSSPFYPCI